MKLICSIAAMALSAFPAAADMFKPSPDEADFLRGVIGAEGFNCPVVKTVSDEGVDAYGTVYIVRCGVPGQWQRIAYRVTISADNRTIIKPME